MYRSNTCLRLFSFPVLKIAFTVITRRLQRPSFDIYFAFAALKVETRHSFLNRGDIPAFAIF